jgi:hypothetical protein
MTASEIIVLESMDERSVAKNLKARMISRYRN